MMDKVTNLIKDGSIIIPRILFSNYKKLKLSEKELILLISLINENNGMFDPNKIAKELNIELIEVLEMIESLNTKDLIIIDTCDEGNVRKEVVNLDNLYNKLAYLVANEKVEEQNNSSSVYDTFEKEFGRTLSPIEYELINGWIEEKFSEEIINCALKEAVFNGVNNLRYIDKILYEWKKKGINNREDVLKDKQKFNNKKVEKKELFDYDWLNDSDE